jgi:hypothetical protein
MSSGHRTALVMLPDRPGLPVAPALDGRGAEVTVMLQGARFSQAMRIVCGRAGFDIDFDLRHDPELSADVTGMSALDFVRLACAATGVQLEEDRDGDRPRLRFRN